jgi:hypothetical protein
VATPGATPAAALQEMMSSVNPVSVERALPAEVENSIVFAAEKAIIEEVEEAWDAEIILNLYNKPEEYDFTELGDTIVRAAAFVEVRGR